MLQLLLLDYMYIEVLRRQMPPIVNDRSSSVVCRSVCHLVSPAENSKVSEIPFAFRTRLAQGRPITYSGPLGANTVLRSFNTIQSSSNQVKSSESLIRMSIENVYKT